MGKITRLTHWIVLSWGWRRALVAFGAGAVSALAMAPFDAWPVLFFTFPMLLWLGDGAAAGRRAIDEPHQNGKREEQHRPGVERRHRQRRHRARAERHQRPPPSPAQHDPVRQARDLPHPLPPPLAGEVATRS